MVTALKDIGFDGALAIDYRGEGDPDDALRHGLEAIGAALETV
jgi:hypothetical protein